MQKFLLLALLIVGAPLWGRESPPLLSVAGGIFRTGYPKPYFQVELKGSFPHSYLRPQLGFATSQHHVSYLYGGLGLDFYLFKHLVLTPSFSPGAYWKGNGKNLGHILEFRSALELALVSLLGHRLGGQFMHLSNASLGHHNPGVNAAVVFFSLPL